MSGKLKKRNELELIIFIFCFLFAPPVIPNFNFIFIVFSYSIIMITIKYRSKLKRMLNIKSIRNIIKIIFIYFCIYILSMLINSLIDGEEFINNYLINMYAIVLAFPIIITCSLYLIFRCDELGIDFDNLIQLFIKAGMIQAMIALITLISPAAKNWTISMMYKATGDKLLNTPWLTARRFYGFAHSMLDMFGFGTGILAVLPLYYSAKTKKGLYLLLSPILLIVPALNARSGLIMFALGLIVYYIYMVMKREIKFGAVLKYFVIIMIIVAMGIYLINIWSPDTLTWIAKDFKSFILSEDTNNEGTADQLFSKEFWQLPPTIGIIIGTGHNISGYSEYAVEGIEHSDVGYVNELWKTGIIGSFLLYYFIHYLIKNAVQNSNSNKYKGMFIFFEIAVFVFMIKATIFTYNPGNVIIYTLALMAIYTNYKSKETENNEQ